MLSNEDAYQWLINNTIDLPKNASKAQKCDLAAKFFIEKRAPAANKKLLCTKFQRLLDSKPGNTTSIEKYNEWKKIVFFEMAAPPQDEKPKQRGQPCLFKEATEQN